MKGHRLGLFVVIAVFLALTPSDPAQAASQYKRYIHSAEAAEAAGDWYEAVRMYRLALKEKPGKQKVLKALDAASGRAASMKAGDIQSTLSSMGVFEAADFTSYADIAHIENAIQEGLSFDGSNSALEILLELTAEGRRCLQAKQGDLLDQVRQQLADKQWDEAGSALESLRAINASSPSVTEATRDFENAINDHFGHLVSDAEAASDISKALQAASTASRLTGTDTWRSKAEFYDQLAQVDQLFSSGQVGEAHALATTLGSWRVDSPTSAALVEQVTTAHSAGLVAEAEDLLGEHYWAAIHRLKDAADLGNSQAQALLAAERDKASRKLASSLSELVDSDRCGQAVFEIQAYAAGFGSPGQFGSTLAMCDTILRQRIPTRAALQLEFDGIDEKHSSLLTAALTSAARDRFGAISLGDSPLALKLTVGSEYVNSSEYERSDSVKYVRTHRTEQNPNWATWKSTRDLTYRQSDNQWVRAAIDAAEPPRTIQVPVYDNHQYAIQVREIDGSLSGSLEAVMTTFEGTELSLVFKSDSVTYHADDEGHGAFAPGNLSHDPLNVPNEVEVVRTMASDLATKLVPTQSEVSQQVVNAMKTRAEELVMMGDQELAVEYIMTLIGNGHDAEKLTQWLKENVL